MIMAASLVAQLMGVAAAIVLFARMRSIGTGLFLVGTIAIPAYPLLAIPLGVGAPGSVGAKLAAFLVVGAPLCASLGLLWHAITTPKPNTVTKANNNAVG